MRRSTLGSVSSNQLQMRQLPGDKNSLGSRSSFGRRVSSGRLSVAGNGKSRYCQLRSIVLFPSSLTDNLFL